MTESAVRGSVRRAWSMVLVLSCVFVMQGSGCDDENNTTIISGEELIESLFPGTPIADNNIGNDGQSLSDADLILNQGYVVFRNASNNTAILLHTDKAERLWAYFFNGTGFTPGVEIKGVNQLDYDADLGVTSGGFGGSDENHQTWRSYQVLFLNTGGNGNANAAARHGDAIVIWNKADFEPPPGADPDADSNFRLYGTYFDASLASTPVSGDVRHGFDTTATTIDFDNQVGGDDDDVSAAGFVSDSLVLSHSYGVHDNTLDTGGGSSSDFELNLEEPTLSGDPTTFAYIVWRKANNDGTPASTAARYHQVQFDLTAATNDIPSEPSLGAGVLPLPPGVTLNPGVDVDGGTGVDPSRDSGFVVHNGDMIWRGETTAIPLTDSMELALFLTRFATGGSIATIELGDTLFSGQTPFMPLKTAVYGGDHGGLLALYAFFAGGDSLHVSKSDLDAALARETTNLTATVGGEVNQFFFTRINRTADWIMPLWIENLSGINQVFAEAVQTRGPGDGPRTLANSLSGAVQAPNQDAGVSLSYIHPQSEVADGMRNPACGVQSNRNRINFAFQQANPLDSANQRLLHNGLVFTADGTGSAPPTAVAALLGATDGLVDEHDTSYDFLGDDMRPVLTDLGVSSGAPVIYFLRNDNNQADATAPGAFTEIRVFGAPGLPGAAVCTLIGTDGALVDNTINTTMFDSGEQPIDELSDEAQPGGSNFLRVQTTPLNPNVGSAPNHGGTLTHIFFEEARGGGNSLWALKTRVFQKTAFSEAIPTGFGGAHSPAAPTSPPIVLDGTLNSPTWVYPTFHDETSDVGVLGNMFVVQGNTVGVFFQSDDDQGAHFWYQEFSGSSWYTDAGQGDPQQIDNKFGSNAFFGHDQMGFAFPGFSNSACDNRAGTIACYIRNLPGDDPHVRRLFTRVIN